MEKKAVPRRKTRVTFIYSGRNSTLVTTMADKVKRLGIQKKPGYLYFVDKQGNVSSTPMARGGKRSGGAGSNTEAIANINREPGYLYFVDKDGDISRSKMARGRK